MPGKFIALEGADGTGKTRLAQLAVEELASRGYVVEIVNYRSATTVGHFDAVIAAVGTLFRSEHFNTTPLDALSLASATQHSLIHAGTVRPSLDRGVILIADGWRRQTYARLLVGATRALRLSEDRLQAWSKWLEELFDLDTELSSEPQPYTILVAASQQDRQHWYAQTAPRELIFDRTGAPSTDVLEFGLFTEEVQQILQVLADTHRWPKLMNSNCRSLDSVVAELVRLVTEAPHALRDYDRSV